MQRPRRYQQAADLMNITLLLSFENEALFAYRHDVKAFLSTAYRILPDGYAPDPQIMELSDRFVLAVWTPIKSGGLEDEASNTGLLKHADGAALAYAGYAEAGVLDGAIPRIFDLIGSQSQDRLLLADSPGGLGMYMYVSPDHRAAYAWSTQPPVVPAFVAKNRRSFSAVSNRPRLAFAASVLSTSLRPMSRGYLSRYLTAGCAIDGTTPYPNTFATPGNASLRLQDGSYEVKGPVLERREAIPQETSLETKSEELAALLSAACKPIAALGPAYLFLSGGKDSRTVAAALHSLNADITPFTYGNSGNGEARIAEQVSKAVGWEFETQDMDIICDPLRAAARSHRVTDGLGANFAHQFNFAYDLAFTQSQPAFHGHGHLLRGGNARTMNGQRDYLASLLDRSFVSIHVTEDCARSTREALQSWRASRQPVLRDGRDILYYAHQELRLWVFTASNLLDVTSKASMVYPLLDEKVAQFAEALSAFDRVSERVVFGSIKQLSPAIADIPLYENIWRFDRDPNRTDFPDANHNFQDGYEKRRPVNTSRGMDTLNGPGAFNRDADYVEGYDRNRVAAAHVLDSILWPEVRRLVTSEVATEIENRAVGKKTDGRGNADRNAVFTFDAFLDRVFLATTLLDGTW